MTRLSIVVLMQGDPQRMEASLVPILQHRPQSAEVVVVLNGPYEDPYDLSDEVKFVRAPRRADWARSANVGLAHCQGEVVHLVGSGTEVTDGWTAKVLPLFDDPGIASVSPLLRDADNPALERCSTITLTATGRRRVLEGEADSKALKKLTAADAPLGCCWQAGFYRRRVLEALGGFDAGAGDALADVEMAARLHVAGYRHVCQHESLVHVPADETPRRGLRWAMRSQRLFWRTVPVRGWPASLLLHPFAVLGEALLNARHPLTALLQLTGRTLGLIHVPGCRRHHRALAQLRESLERPSRSDLQPREASASGGLPAEAAHATPSVRETTPSSTAA